MKCLKYLKYLKYLEYLKLVRLLVYEQSEIKQFSRTNSELSEESQRELLGIFREAGTIRRNPVDSSGHGIFPGNALPINEIVASDP